MLSLRLMAAAAAFVVGSVAGAGTAWADGGPGRPDADAKPCDFESFCVGAGTPYQPGGSGQKPAGGSGSGSKKPPVCTVNKMEPQPPAGSQYWQGHDPKDGALYIRSCRHYMDSGASAVFGELVWGANGAPPAAVDPAVLAQQAVDKMLLTGPEIQLAPGAGKTGLVGMPVWMWTEVGPTTFGPNSASATAGGVTVTATAKVSKIVWVMGDGTSVTCTGPGTAYTASYGKRTSPTCGHVYARTSGSRPGSQYTVTATSTWVIDWQVTGSGGGGQLTQTRNSQTQVAIGELQAVGR
ncbi:ATP/GTP-binding protein [Streptomyces lunaelactis]|uniref:ATP/GTP-binding protein n=1 Tax=Streptomyces lunaelactis TaxID=1535768 RepID=A0A2R4SVN9_9ACTN|nr:ATP/GTP-binding protein [Streptomyces lunaelactis]AVZ70926.1 ATP/GTP-binding protein [Streptomyces lunaelactis]NUK25182.1 ATP/GTP-binding protein [Streptomyces lunaelactis]NUK85607.1 ATP/GTP-binding protein [Streptomyces lunaelactis]